MTSRKILPFIFIAVGRLPGSQMSPSLLIRERISGGSLRVGFETRMVMPCSSLQIAAVDQSDLRAMPALRGEHDKRDLHAVLVMLAPLGLLGRHLGLR